MEMEVGAKVVRTKEILLLLNDKNRNWPFFVLLLDGFLHIVALTYVFLLLLCVYEPIVIANVSTIKTTNWSCSRVTTIHLKEHQKRKFYLKTATIRD
jgi:hypothetical protein